MQKTIQSSVSATHGGAHVVKQSLLKPNRGVSFGQTQPSFRRSKSSIITKAAAARSDVAYPRWEKIYADLTQTYGMESLTPQDAAAMVNSGKAVIVDVRLAKDFEEAHPTGAVNVPAFYIIDMTKAGSVATFVKGLAFMANGVQPTENNPNFVADVKQAAGGADRAVIFCCEAGGSLQPTANFATGKVSRSLKAAWKALNGGAVAADKAYHLQGGVYGWSLAELPMTGEYDARNVGRTPNVVMDTKEK